MQPAAKKEGCCGSGPCRMSKRFVTPQHPSVPQHTATPLHTHTHTKDDGHDNQTPATSQHVCRVLRLCSFDGAAVHSAVAPASFGVGQSLCKSLTHTNKQTASLRGLCCGISSGRDQGGFLWTLSHSQASSTENMYKHILSRVYQE